MIYRNYISGGLLAVASLTSSVCLDPLPRGMTPSGSARRRCSPEGSSSVTARRAGPLSSGTAGRANPCGCSGAAVGSSSGGGAERSLGGDSVKRASFLFPAPGKVYLKAFLTANRVIAYIDRTIVRLLAESGSPVPDRSHTLHDAAVSCCSGVDPCSPALDA